MKNRTFTPLQAELRVTRKAYLTPHFIRVWLGGGDISAFADTTVGTNNKILIPPEGVDKIHFPTLTETGIIPPPPDVRPFIRTYTHRGIDLKNNELWIDFVAHGDEGPASKWAIEAKPGDVLGVMMKSGRKPFYTKADNYLLVGDATAIPVLSAILEDLSPREKGTCIIEVHGKEDEQILETQAAIRFVWLHNEHPQSGSRLAETVGQQILPETSRSGYIAAEFSSVREIRRYLRQEKGWKQEELYAFSYWKSGVAEDKSQAERQKEKES